MHTFLLMLSMTAMTAMTWQEKEEFLRNAKIVKTKGAQKGVTGTVQVTLSDGKLTHDASVQRIDESKAKFEGAAGASEINFRDSYKFNIAAWKLALMLGLEDMVPPSVERFYSGSAAAYTWWIDDVMMDEGERLKKKTEAPDKNEWNKELLVMHVFDQLIHNMDRNVGNMLIDKQWHLWMIDHTRAFRLFRQVKNPKMLQKCDRALLEKMKTLTEANLREAMGVYLTREEVRGLLGRRDAIVKPFAAKGDSVLYDRASR
ncbi:MAG: hypothetical protein FJ303_27655 [Planctomycetes bacterium]|nr:hypothetical protein [Planctomycetota bacterium]